ncbi:AarF/UbiB family protein [Oerskovia sp. M15]
MLATFSDATRQAIAARLLRVTLDQIVVTGVFHADLHPGNVLLREDGSLGLLDFGSVGRLDEAERVALAAVLLAVEADDSIAATDALIELLDQPDSFDERRFERAVGQLILRFRGDGPRTAARSSQPCSGSSTTRGWGAVAGRGGVPHDRCPRRDAARPLAPVRAGLLGA